MSTTTTTAAATAAKTDAYALKLKAEGATWKFIATELLGASWNGANMDGGRALRAVNRAKRAGVNADDVKLPAALAKKLATAKAAKPAAKTAPKAPAKPAAKTAPKAPAKPAAKTAPKAPAKPAANPASTILPSDSPALAVKTADVAA